MSKDQNKLLLAILLLVFLAPIHAVSSVYVLPINRDIGQIIEPDPTQVEAYAKGALTDAYTPEWVETYVPPSLAVGFVHTYNDLLASLLPAHGIQMGRAVQRTHLWEVGFVVTEPTYRWGSMVWMDQNDGRWALLSISISE